MIDKTETITYTDYMNMLSAIFNENTIEIEDDDSLNVFQYVLMKFDNFIELSRVCRFNIGESVHDSMMIRTKDNKWGMLFKLHMFSSVYNDDIEKNLNIFRQSASLALNLESFAVEFSTSADTFDFFDIYDNKEDFKKNNPGYRTIIENNAFEKLRQILV